MTIRYVRRKPWFTSYVEFIGPAAALAFLAIGATIGAASLAAIESAAPILMRAF